MSNVTTNRAEGGHSSLKASLRSSTGDLDQVVNAIKMKILNQKQDYQLKESQVKHWRPLFVYNALYREIIAYVSPSALYAIHDQKEYLDKPPEERRSCTGRFTKTMGLPCSHLIQQRLTETGCIKLTDVHPHWQYKAPIYRRSRQEVDIISIDLILQVANPPRVRIRGRPAGATNLNRRQHEHEWSTCRDPLQWELVDADVNAQLQAEAEGQMTEENFAVEWLAEEARAIAAEQQVSALNLTASKGMNQSIQVDKYIQIDETDEAPQGNNVTVATSIINLTTNNTTRLPIQSDEGLPNEVTASSRRSTRMRHPTKRAVEAEAPHRGTKRLRQVWTQAGNEILGRFICYFGVFLMQNREFDNAGFLISQ